MTTAHILIPVVWNNRLLIFFPQFMKKTVPARRRHGKTFQDLAKDKVDDHKPTEFWEIKMGWSEYRNGKWTQKQQSAKGIYATDITSPLPDVTILSIRSTNCNGR